MLKVMKNPDGVDLLSNEEIEKIKDYDLSLISVVPYFFSIQIMPLNFVDFWPLSATIDNFKKGGNT